MMPRILIAALALVALTTAVIFQSDPAQAWKPYTHNFTADFAYEDAVLDGMVRINGRDYPLDTRLVHALQQKRAHYNAGVVGPDGFPDSVFGQAIIHPENTGAWLKYMLKSAWEAQEDGSPYTEDQKLEILAFSYGYLTHAAGDMWAHTLVNEFTGGLADIFGGPDAAAFTVKHLILEAYMGDATPGFDGNPDRNPTGGLNEDGDPDVSDDSTHGIAFAPPPDKFLYDVFIALDPDADGNLVLKLDGQPTAERGRIFEFFYNLRNYLNDAAGTNSNYQEFVEAYEDVKARFAYAIEACTALLPPRPDDCFFAVIGLGYTSFSALFTASESLLAAAAEEIVDAYFAAWVEDIDYGLQHWSGIGMTFTTGLFDPQTRRDQQNANTDPGCGEKGSETDQARIDCENDFGQLDTLFAVLDPHLTSDAAPHLLSMIGVPDPALEISDAITAILEYIDALVDFPNPLEEAKADLKDYLKDNINEALAEELGFDPLIFAELLKNPASYLDPVHSPLNLPPPLDTLDQVGGLFQAGDHERLDRIMGMNGEGLVDEHHDLPSRRLDDNAAFLVSALGASDFIPIENTIITSKLLLLDGTALNQVLSDQLGRTVATYPPTGNFMITALGSEAPWLHSIDSDHAWRQDGLPDFCTEGDPCLPATPDRPAPIPREAKYNGGTGRMPVWESCVLRPAFRSLYRDWQHAADNQFPDYSDAVSADPESDPNPPTSNKPVVGGAYYNDGVREFIGGNSVFTLSASDTPADKGFPNEALGLQYRISTEANPALRGDFIDSAQGGQFSVTGADGRYFIDVRSSDPCHTFADEDGPAVDGDPMPPEAFLTFEFWLDTTPPVVTCDNPPFGRTFDTDDFSNVDYEVDDGVNGSGVASFSSTINGFLVLPGVVPIADGAVLDMYQYYPSTRTVMVTAADNIGNSGAKACTFEIHATTDSLLSNLARARAEGKLGTSPGTYNSLHAKLKNADKKHDGGAHATEHNMLGAFINELQAQRGKHVDTATANRFIAFAQDLIATGG